MQSFHSVDFLRAKKKVAEADSKKLALSTTFLNTTVRETLGDESADVDLKLLQKNGTGFAQPPAFSSGI